MKPQLPISDFTFSYHNPDWQKLRALSHFAGLKREWLRLHGNLAMGGVTSYREADVEDSYTVRAGSRSRVCSRMREERMLAVGFSEIAASNTCSLGLAPGLPAIYAVS